MATKVVHKRNRFDVYIGRPSKWGNPFHVGAKYTREQAVAAYRKWICEQPELLASLHELKDKRLGCFCAPLACHGDVLAEMADALPP